jgi:outer membrane protein OmpA-like peptidoglycan-associated protein
MRRSLGLPLLLLPLLLPLLPPPARAEAPASFPPPAERADGKRPSLQVSIDRSKVDLPGHKLEVTLSRAADKVRIKVVGNSGAVLAEVEKAFAGAAPGTVLAMSWTPASEEDVAKIEVWGYDTEGFYSGVAIVPWKVEVAHEEVTFETDSDVIRASEVPKLEAVLPKLVDTISKRADLGKITLFVLGHTDTMGTNEHNLVLSRKRARAIAAWFRDHGIKSVSFEGLGKSGQLVKTADQVDEPRNRHVGYFLSLEPPPLPAGEFSWKTP